MTSKLTILSIDPETAGEDVRRMQEALCLLEQLRQLLASFMREFAQRGENRRLHIYTDCNLMD